VSKDDVRLIEAIVEREIEGILWIFLTPFATPSCVTLDLNGCARASRGGKKKGSQETRAIRERMSRFRWLNVVRGRGTDEQAKNKRTRGWRRGSLSLSLQGIKRRGGRVGVGNGAWIESLYGNEKLRRKSVGRNVEWPLILHGDNSDVTLDELVIKIRKVNGP